MTLISGAMVFLVIWWVVLFMVLPFGVRTDHTPPKGFATGTPENPNLGKKFLITTLITGVVWAVIEGVIVKYLVT